MKSGWKSGSLAFCRASSLLYSATLSLSFLLCLLLSCFTISQVFSPPSDRSWWAVSATATWSGPKLRFFRLQCAAAPGWASREDPPGDPQGAEDQGRGREFAEGHHRQKKCPAGGLTAPQLQAQVGDPPRSASRARCTHCGQGPWWQQRYSISLYIFIIIY